jgi:N-acetylmuramoyl-L-alanine amidase
VIGTPPPLVCLDPGHGTPPAIGQQLEPVGPGSHTLKIKDGGGTSGEPAVALAIARKTRALLIARGYRVAMTRTGPTFHYGSGGNIGRHLLSGSTPTGPRAGPSTG